MDRAKRSSILKPSKMFNLTTNELNEEEEDLSIPTPGKHARMSMRRVSFASSNYIKEFAADPERVTIWNTTYEETIDKSDSTPSLQNTLCMHTEHLNLGDTITSTTKIDQVEKTMNFQLCGGESILLDTTLINSDYNGDKINDPCNKENEVPRHKVGDNMDLTTFAPFKEKTILQTRNKTVVGNHSMELTFSSFTPSPNVVNTNKTVYDGNMELDKTNILSITNTSPHSTLTSDKSMELTLPIDARSKIILGGNNMELTTFIPNNFKDMSSTHKPSQLSIERSIYDKENCPAKNQFQIQNEIQLLPQTPMLPLGSSFQFSCLSQPNTSTNTLGCNSKLLNTRNTANGSAAISTSNSEMGANISKMEAFGGKQTSKLLHESQIHVTNRITSRKRASTTNIERESKHVSLSNSLVTSDRASLKITNSENMLNASMFAEDVYNESSSILCEDSKNTAVSKIVTSMNYFTESPTETCNLQMDQAKSIKQTIPNLSLDITANFEKSFLNPTSSNFIAMSSINMNTTSLSQTLTNFTQDPLAVNSNTRKETELEWIEFLPNAHRVNTSSFVGTSRAPSIAFVEPEDTTLNYNFLNESNESPKEIISMATDFTQSDKYKEDSNKGLDHTPDDLSKVPSFNYNFLNESSVPQKGLLTVADISKDLPKPTSSTYNLLNKSSMFSKGLISNVDITKDITLNGKKREDSKHQSIAENSENTPHDFPEAKSLIYNTLNESSMVIIKDISLNDNRSEDRKHQSALENLENTAGNVPKAKPLIYDCLDESSVLLKGLINNVDVTKDITLNYMKCEEAEHADIIKDVTLTDHKSEDCKHYQTASEDIKYVTNDLPKVTSMNGKPLNESRVLPKVLRHMADLTKDYTLNDKKNEDTEQCQSTNEGIEDIPKDLSKATSLNCNFLNECSTLSKGSMSVIDITNDVTLNENKNDDVKHHHSTSKCIENTTDDLPKATSLIYNTLNESSVVLKDLISNADITKDITLNDKKSEDSKHQSALENLENTLGNLTKAKSAIYDCLNESSVLSKGSVSNTDTTKKCTLNDTKQEDKDCQLAGESLKHTTVNLPKVISLNYNNSNESSGPSKGLMCNADVTPNGMLSEDSKHYEATNMGTEYITSNLPKATFDINCTDTSVHCLDQSSIKNTSSNESRLELQIAKVEPLQSNSLSEFEKFLQKRGIFEVSGFDHRLDLTTIDEPRTPELERSVKDQITVGDSNMISHHSISQNQNLAESVIDKSNDFKNNSGLVLNATKGNLLDVSNVSDTNIFYKSPETSVKKAVDISTHTQKCSSEIEFDTESQLQDDKEKIEIENTLLVLKNKSFNFEEVAYDSLSIVDLSSKSGKEARNEDVSMIDSDSVHETLKQEPTNESLSIQPKSHLQSFSANHSNAFNSNSFLNFKKSAKADACMEIQNLSNLNTKRTQHTVQEYNYSETSNLGNTSTMKNESKIDIKLPITDCTYTKKIIDKSLVNNQNILDSKEITEIVTHISIPGYKDAVNPVINYSTTNKSFLLKEVDLSTKNRTYTKEVLSSAHVAGDQALQEFNLKDSEACDDAMFLASLQLKLPTKNITNKSVLLKGADLSIKNHTYTKEVLSCTSQLKSPVKNLTYTVMDKTLKQPHEEVHKMEVDKDLCLSSYDVTNEILMSSLECDQEFTNKESFRAGYPKFTTTYIPTTPDDTQLLINMDLDKEKFIETTPKSDFSKIIAGENPPCMSKRFMKLTDFSSSAFPTSLENTRDHCSIDNQHLQESIRQLTNLYSTHSESKNICEESLQLCSSLNETFTPIATATQCAPNSLTSLETTYEGTTYHESVTENLSDKLDNFEVHIQQLNAHMAKSISNILNRQQEMIKIAKGYVRHAESVLAEMDDTDNDCSFDLSLDSCSLETMNAEQPAQIELPFNIESETITTIKEKIENRSKSSTCWNIMNIQPNELKINTLYKTIHLTISFDEETGFVHKIDKTYKLNNASHPHALFVLQLFKEKLTSSVIAANIGEHYDVFSFIDYICSTMKSLTSILNMFDKLEDQFGFKIHSNLQTATFKVFIFEQLSIWNVVLNISDLYNMTEDCVSLSAEVGELQEADIKALVKNCSRGVDFLSEYMHKVYWFGKCQVK